MIGLHSKLLFSIVLLFLSPFASGQREDNRPVPPPLSDGDYDFIVAGAGTSGSIVAARLASAGQDVLVIDSGYRLYDNPTLNMNMLVPILFGVDLTESAVGNIKSILEASIKSVEGGVAATTELLLSTLNSISGLPTDHHRKRGILRDVLGGIIGGEDSSEPESSPGNNVNGTVIFAILRGLRAALDGDIALLLPNLQLTPSFATFITLSEAAHYYSTLPQAYGQKREITYPRGKLVGGSSAINQMVYFRGSKKDFDEWEDEYGLTGWGYDDVLPFFKKFENNQAIPNSRLHGYSGPINVTLSHSHFKSLAAEAWVKAAVDMGYELISDSSDLTKVYGTSFWQSFVGDNGRRSDTSAYIRILDAKGLVCWNKPKDQCDPQQKLSIWTETQVTKVLFDGTRATGVEYAKGVGLDRTDSPLYPLSENEGVKHHSQFNKWNRESVQTTAERLGAPVDRDLAFDLSRPYDQFIPEIRTVYTPNTVTAKYEVILSTGAVGTPQLLMLSGIGPAIHLREQNIPTLVDLPVGQHTQDHQEIFLQWKYPSSYEPKFSFLSEVLGGAPELTKFLKSEKSYFSYNFVPAGLDGSSKGPKGTIPTWHMHHINIGPLENLDQNILQSWESANPPYRLPRSLVELLLWEGGLLHTHGCELSGNHAYGKIELRNTDPFVPPFIDPRFGSSYEDNMELIDCIRTLRYLMGNTTDSRFVGVELEPHASAKTDQELLQLLRNNVWGHHISGSAPMGTSKSEFAVTDHKARVYGVEGLRVVDISLFPTIPHGNPAAIVMMIGEKLAADIFEDYELSAPEQL